MVEVEFVAPIEVRFAASVIVVEVQIDSDSSFQAKMRLVAPFAEMLIVALMI